MENKIKGEFNHIDELIDVIIKKVSLGEMVEAAKDLIKLAKSFSEVGLEMSSFLDIRLYIVEQAKKDSKIKSIHEKLNNAEKQLRGTRNASNKQSKQSA